MILALEEWKPYVQGTSHPVTITTDHKNLSYIKDPRKLSQRQARWSLFLQDFDIIWKVLRLSTPYSVLTDVVVFFSLLILSD